MPQECHARVSHTIVREECQARVVFNAIEHLLFPFHCSVGTLLLRELLENAFGSVASIRFWVHLRNLSSSIFYRSLQQYRGKKTCAECQKEYRSKSEERHKKECKGKKAAVASHQHRTVWTVWSPTDSDFGHWLLKNNSEWFAPNSWLRSK